jgi:hypothetical protein
MTTQELILQLYQEPRPKHLRKNLRADGVTSLEAAYTRGWQHALAELKCRLELPKPKEESWGELPHAGP